MTDITSSTWWRSLDIQENEVVLMKTETFFSKGIKRIEEDYTKKYSEEELEGRTCGECVRCEPRSDSFPNQKGYHCCMKNWHIDILPTNRACKDLWDKKEHERIEKLNEEAVQKRREELWKIYAEKEPVKLPIVFDGYGMIPECPVCEEMPYDTEQCHWCGQRFIQDDEIIEYSTPKTQECVCPHCGAIGQEIISKYNGHHHFYCEKCGMSIME